MITWGHTIMVQKMHLTDPDAAYPTLEAKALGDAWHSPVLTQLILSLPDRDPVDALNDIEYLCELFEPDEESALGIYVPLDVLNDIERDPAASVWLTSASRHLRVVTPAEALSHCSTLRRLCEARLPRHYTPTDALS